MTKELIKGILSTVGIAAFPYLTFAAPPPVPRPPITSVGGIIGIMCTVFNWMFYFLIILTVIFILFAAFKYLTAGGDPEKVKGANYMLIYAAVAVVVALIAKGFPLIVGTLVGTTGLATC